MSGNFFFYPLLQMGKAHLQAWEDLEVIPMGEKLWLQMQTFSTRPQNFTKLQKYTNRTCVPISNLGLRAAERHDPGRQHEGAPGSHDYPDGAWGKQFSATHFSVQPSSYMTWSERLLFKAGGHVIRSSGSRIISLPCYDPGLSRFFPGRDPAVVQHHLFSQERVRLGQ